MSLNIKKGDAVKIIAGNDNGKTGTILAVNPSDNTVVVKGAGITMAKHFVKPRNAQEKGGIVEKEKAIDASNVMIICPTCNKATKVAHKIEDGKKIRVCKHCGASLDEVKAAKAKKATKTAAKKTTAKKVEAKADAPVAEETVSE